MKTIHEVIREIIGHYTDHLHSVDKLDCIPALSILEEELIAAFKWHPIDRADEFGLRTPPPGKNWGPRVVTLIKDPDFKAVVPHVFFWDPDVVQSDGKPVAHPSPYWRSVGHKAAWSRRNQPTHFMIPYSPD